MFLSDRQVNIIQALATDRIFSSVLVPIDGNGLALKGKRSRETPVREIMTEVVATVSRSHSVKDCMAVMTHQRVRHLPVVEDERLIGLVSIGDVVKSIMTDQEFMIHQLENYITGRV